MRIGTWCFIGQEARQVHRAAKQCAAEMSRSTRRLERIRQLEEKLAEAYANLRQAVEDKEQLKGILHVLAPDRLQAWKRERHEDRTRETSA